MSAETEIINRLLVLKKQGATYLLPAIRKMEVQLIGYCPLNYPPLRILSFNPDLNELEVKIDGGEQNEKYYLISTEANSELLELLSITNIKIIKPPLIRTSPKFPDKKQYSRPLENFSSYNEPVFDLELPLFNPITIEPRTSNSTIQLSINDIIIEDGRITFRHYAPEIKEKLKFEVINQNLTAKYDSIKNYFPKILGIKKFTVEITVKHLSGKLLEQSAVSSDILKINESIFDLVRDEIVNELFFESAVDIATTHEKINALPDVIKSKGLNNEQEVLNYLFKSSKTKHHNHLRYLSSKHLHEISHISLTGRPLSFIFVIHDSNNNFIIWETYDTDEATYIWKLQSEFENIKKKEIPAILDRIVWLRKGHKEEYLKSKPTGFKKILHNYNLPGNGFKNWQDQVETFLRTST